MSGSTNIEILRNANIRLCRLRVWQTFEGLGFNLEACHRPPHIIRLVESNSPAAAGGLKILDMVLYVNQQNVSNAEYSAVRNAIKAARDSNGPIELLVIEQRYYQELKKRNIPIEPSYATTIDTPATMPDAYLRFPKHEPRTCNIRLDRPDASFGFEVVSAENDIGAYVQEVFPNTPASKTSLQKSDRIIEIDDKFVDKDISKSILTRLAKAKAKGAVKLYVMDTDTYKHYTLNKMPLQSKGKRRSQSDDRQSTTRSYQGERPYPTDSNPSRIPSDSNPSTLRETSGRPTPSQSVPSSGVRPASSVELSNEDIRLCTIYRADPTDPFGIELNFNRKTELHSLSIIPGRSNGPSNAELAGIRNGDRLIEINGENIQQFGHERVTARIHSIKYPNPLQMLVANAETFDYYAKRNQLIDRNFNSVKIMPPNRVSTSLSSGSSARPSIDTSKITSSRQTPPPISNTFGKQPLASVLNDLTNKDSLTLPTSTGGSLQPRQMSIRKDSQLSNGVGFNFRTLINNPPSNTPYSHIITSVDTSNSIDSHGLRVNDYILSINDENVEYLNHEQLEDKLRRINNRDAIRLLVADENVYRAYKQTGQGSPMSIPPSTHMQQIKPNGNNTNVPHNRRQYRLQRTPEFLGYGFRVRSNPAGNITLHQIMSVEDNSPADRQGLRVGDYILRVNNQPVETMSAPDFNSLMQHIIQNDSPRDGNILLEVMDENTYRTLNPIQKDSSLDQSLVRHSMSGDRETPVHSTYDSYLPPSDELYPKMRLCFIRRWSHYPDLGFTVVDSTNSQEGGYEIQQLRLDSPAAHTKLRNGDHLIQVNNINVEKTNFDHVNQLIKESYHRDGEVSLLVIDDFGYQWYKRNHFRIDPLSQRANVERHVTPEHQAVYTSTDSTIVSPPIRPGPLEPVSGHTEIHLPPGSYQQPITSRPPSTGISNRPYGYSNGYVSPTRDTYQRPIVPPSVASTLTRPRTALSRAAVDVVDGKLMLRFCRLNTEPGQTFGFELSQESNKHIIRNVKPDSPAARAGLHNEDCLVEVNDENVTNRQHRDVVALIKNASNNGVLRLLILPSNVKPLHKPSSKLPIKTKSLPSLNDERIYHDRNALDPYTSWSPYDGPYNNTNQPAMVKYLSTSRLENVGIPTPYPERSYSSQGFDTTQRQMFRSTPPASQSYLPTDPWPRKCVIVQDPSFRGCGFRIVEKPNYDTPIVVEVRSNSPAKRSGITEGDHIIYIENRNIQALRSFNEMTHLIQRTFEETGQVTLVTLTGPAYQVLKRKGGYLQPDPFDYQLPYVRELTPRFCRITLYNDQDFGFTLQRGNPINIKDVHPGSPAYECGLRPNDKILEINIRDTTYLSTENIIEMIELSKRRGQLDLLVIDPAGYEFSMRHAIPLNSFLPFVQSGQQRVISSRNAQQEPVYL